MPQPLPLHRHRNDVRVEAAKRQTAATWRSDPCAEVICAKGHSNHSDRKRVVWGTSVSVCVDIGGRRSIKKTTHITKPVISDHIYNTDTDTRTRILRNY